jgi:prepilin-type N-terminal cleavage/methylation domain-containing protein
MIKRGFTLIEILVAVALLGLMTGLIFAAVSSMFTISKDMDALVEANHMARVSLNRMSRDLSQSFLTLNQGIEERTKSVFIGERDRVVFAYVGNVPVKAGELQTDQGVVEYRLGGTTEDKEGRKLIRRFKPHIDDSPEDGGEEYVMATGVKKLQFEYWSKEDEDWESSWTADDPLAADEPGFILPNRIKIRLEMYDAIGEVHVFETQTLVYMTRPLLFGQPVSDAAKQWQAKDKLKDIEEKAKAIQSMKNMKL